MTTIDCRYTGDLHCEAVRSPSGAPPHRRTDGSRRPWEDSTDLLATSLGTCVLTIMGITAKRRQWDIRGATARVEKQMTQQGPRKIERLKVHVHLPEQCSDDQRRLLMRMAEDCPVKRNLEGALTIELIWT